MHKNCIGKGQGEAMLRAACKASILLCYRVYPSFYTITRSTKRHPLSGFAVCALGLEPTTTRAQPESGERGVRILALRPLAEYVEANELYGLTRSVGPYRCAATWKTEWFCEDASRTNISFRQNPPLHFVRNGEGDAAEPLGVRRSLARRA